jgi:SAM-dependent methyltransferase
MTDPEQGLPTCRLCGHGPLRPFYTQGNRDEYTFHRCPNCSLVNYHLEGGLDQGKYAAEFVDPFDEHHRRNIAQNTTHRFLKRWVPAPGRMLDIGCGNGRLLHLARRDGWDGYFEGPWYDCGPEGNTTDYKEGWLVRFDADGNELWNFNNTVSHDDFFYSCVQLPEGGYITGGTWTGTGYLVRYAPETGIEGGDVISVISLEATPNPFNGSLSVNFTLSELGYVNLEVYDLSGRLVQRLLSEEAVPGLHSVDWSPDASVPSGCYLLRLVCAEETVSRRCVLLR